MAVLLLRPPRAHRLLITYLLTCLFFCAHYTSKTVSSLLSPGRYEMRVVNISKRVIVLVRAPLCLSRSRGLECGWYLLPTFLYPRHMRAPPPVCARFTQPLSWLAGVTFTCKLFKIIPDFLTLTSMPYTLLILIFVYSSARWPT